MFSQSESSGLKFHPGQASFGPGRACHTRLPSDEFDYRPRARWQDLLDHQRDDIEIEEVRVPAMYVPMLNHVTNSIYPFSSRLVGQAHSAPSLTSQCHLIGISICRKGTS